MFPFAVSGPDVRRADGKLRSRHPPCLDACQRNVDDVWMPQHGALISSSAYVSRHRFFHRWFR